MTKRLVRWTLLMMILLVGTVQADVGPKPSLTIQAIHMPEEDCYMDLLIQDVNDYPFENLDDLDRYDSRMLDILKNYDEEGWTAALATGTSVPLFGDISCQIQNGECTQRFSYMGVPDRFKIIVVTESGKIVISNTVERKAFESTVLFDFLTGEAKEESLIKLNLIQLFFTLLMTILIEGIVLLIFSFQLKENYKVFLIVNIITQLILMFTVHFGMVELGTFGALAAYILIEFVIGIIEMILFAIFLKGHKVLRRVVYAFTANLLSFLVGLVFMVISGLGIFI